MSDFVTIAAAVANVLASADPDTTASAAAAAASDAARETAHGLLTIGRGAAYGAAAGGCGTGIGVVVAAAISGIARQPEQRGQLMTLMFIGIGFIEVFALIGFAYLFILK